MKVRREFREEIEYCEYHQLMYLPIYASDMVNLCDVYAKSCRCFCLLQHCPDFGLLQKGLHGLAQYSGHPGALSWLPAPCLLSVSVGWVGRALGTRKPSLPSAFLQGLVAGLHGSVMAKGSHARRELERKGKDGDYPRKVGWATLEPCHTRDVDFVL